MARTLGLHHTTTDTAVVRRFLALKAGGPCSQFRLRESERLLRAQPFLASATVRAVSDDSGGARVEVETVDEIPAIGGASFSGVRLTSLEIGNENMLGDAWLLALRGSQRPLEGRAAGIRAADFQFLGRPYVGNLLAEVGQRTASWLVAARHEYLTDLQRMAWETGLTRVNRSFVVLRRGDKISDVAVSYRSAAADVGGIVRLSGIHSPVLFGAVASMARFDPIGVVAVTDSGVISDTALATRYQKLRRTRVSGVGVWRDLRFVTVNGFDALTAAQDLPTGIQLFSELGRGMHIFEGESDIFMRGNVLLGAGGHTVYTAVNALAEGRRAQAGTWDGVVGSARLTTYWKRSSNELVRFWADYAGGSKVRTPYQLQLATDEQRVGGYRTSLAGARRAGGGVEFRRVLPSFSPRIDFGVSAFAQAARLWAGDVPYGVDTPILPSAGIGLLAAVPRGSKKLLRLDVAFPLRQTSARSGIAIRFSFYDRSGVLRAESRDIESAREKIVGTNVFKP
jgi:hypothetical protein